MVRFGVIGTNFISDWFVGACARTDGAAVPTAVYSRAEGTGSAFAARHGIREVFTDLSQMCRAVDAVYIASPTGAHYDQAMMAIEAGRHVLVEKTMTQNAGQTEQIFAAAQTAGVVAMEATRSLHAPTHTLIRDAIAGIGTLRYAHLENLQYSSRYDRFLHGEVMNAFDPDLGNSALADIGVYCLEPALDWFGDPDSQNGASVRLENGFEALGSIQLVYPQMLVDVVYSKVAQSVTPSTIVGEGGTVTIDNLGQPTRVVLERRDGTTRVLLDLDGSEPSENMHYEINAFVAQLAAGRADPRWRDVTLRARQIMDAHLAG